MIEKIKVTMTEKKKKKENPVREREKEKEREGDIFIHHRHCFGSTVRVWRSGKSKPFNYKITLVVVSDIGRTKQLQDILLHGNKNLGVILESSLNLF